MAGHPETSPPAPTVSRQATASRWVPHAYLVTAGALIPWIIYLAFSLPRRSFSDDYRGTWVGFDVLLTIVLASIGIHALRQDSRLVPFAASGATLLLVDAWFDVTTAAPGAAHAQAVLSALTLELPGALLCGLLASRGLRTLTVDEPSGQRQRGRPSRCTARHRHRTHRGSTCTARDYTRHPQKER